MTNNPFPGHHPRPVSVDTLDGIEAVALAIHELHDAMLSVPPEYRWLASSMMSEEIADVLRMIQADQFEFATRNLRDRSGLITMTPVAGPPTA